MKLNNSAEALEDDFEGLDFDVFQDEEFSEHPTKNVGELKYDMDLIKKMCESASSSDDLLKSFEQQGITIKQVEEDGVTKLAFYDPQKNVIGLTGADFLEDFFGYQDGHSTQNVSKPEQNNTASNPQDKEGPSKNEAAQKQHAEQLAREQQQAQAKHQAQSQAQPAQGNAFGNAIGYGLGAGAGLIKSLFDNAKDNLVGNSIQGFDHDKKNEWLKKRNEEARQAGAELISDIADINSLIDKVQSSEIYDRHEKNMRVAKTDEEKEKIRNDFKYELKSNFDKNSKATKKNMDQLFNKLDNLDNKTFSNLQKDFEHNGDTEMAEKVAELCSSLRDKDPHDLMVDPESKNTLAKKLEQVVEKIRKFVNKLFGKDDPAEQEGLSPR